MFKPHLYGTLLLGAPQSHLKPKTENDVLRYFEYSNELMKLGDLSLWQVKGCDEGRRERKV